jgi:hypothetical protein
MNVEKVGLVQMAFRYLTAVSEDDDEAHIREIDVIEIEEGVTDDRNGKPQLDRRKYPFGENASDNDLRLVESVGSPRHCRLPAPPGRPSDGIFCTRHLIRNLGDPLRGTREFGRAGFEPGIVTQTRPDRSPPSPIWNIRSGCRDIAQQ